MQALLHAAGCPRHIRRELRQQRGPGCDLAKMSRRRLAPAATVSQGSPVQKRRTPSQGSSRHNARNATALPSNMSVSNGGCTLSTSARLHFSADAARYAAVPTRPCHGHDPSVHNIAGHTCTMARMARRRTALTARLCGTAAPHSRHTSPSKSILAAYANAAHRAKTSNKAIPLPFHTSP